MASSRGMAAPTVILPTVPTMGSASASRPTKPLSSRSSSRVVKVPRATSRRTEPKVRAPKIKVARPKMPKDANLLMVPKAKRVKNPNKASFYPKRKPVI